MQPGMASAAVAKKPAISVSANWGSNDAGTNVITSATRTISAPPGAVLLLDITGITGAVTSLYSKNGGGFTSFVDNDTLAIAHGDTLAFRVSGATTIGYGYDLTVKNNVGGASVGTCSFVRT